MTTQYQGNENACANEQSESPLENYGISLTQREVMILPMTNTYGLKQLQNLQHVQIWLPLVHKGPTNQF